MNTQQLGTDISADVSFDFGGPAGAFRPTYQFKGSVTNPAVGQYRVTVAAGEGIDIDHAEVNVHHGHRVGDAPTLTCLMWRVVRETATAAGEARFSVFFERNTLAGNIFSCAATDVSFGSITIRRKVPAVNTNP